MKKIISLSVLTVLSLGIIGCAASGKKFSGFQVPKQDKGLLYIYRDNQMFGAGNDYSVINKTDKKEIGILKNGGYLVSEMNTGNNEIIIDVVGISNVLYPIQMITDSTVGHKVFIRKNEISCLRFDLGFGGKQVEVDKETCQQEIKNLKDSK